MAEVSSLDEWNRRLLESDRKFYEDLNEIRAIRNMPPIAPSYEWMKINPEPVISDLKSNQPWRESFQDFKESFEKMKQAAEELRATFGQMADEMKKLREESEASEQEVGSCEDCVVDNDHTKKVVDEPVPFTENLDPNLENQDAAVLSSSLDDSNQNFRGKGIFTESESTEDRLKTIHEECDASSQVVGDDPEEEVISDISKFVNSEVQEQEMFRISVVPIETNIAYNVFDKMSNMEIGLNSSGVGTNLILGLNSDLKVRLGRQNQDCVFLGKHLDESIDEFGYRGFQWDPGVGFTDSLNSRDHILKQMMSISDYDEVFKALPIELQYGFGDSFGSINSKRSFTFDPGGIYALYNAGMIVISDRVVVVMGAEIANQRLQWDPGGVFSWPATVLGIKRRLQWDPRGIVIWRSMHETLISIAEPRG